MMGGVVMKKHSITFMLFCLVILAGCNSDENKSDESSNSGGKESVNKEEEATDNLFDSNNVEEGIWIGQSGSEIKDEDMVITKPIDYNSELEYTMNKSAYVTYMSGDQIISTVLYDQAPFTLKKDEKADSIRISFDKSKIENFELKAK